MSSIPRFFVTPDAIDAERKQIVLPPDVTHHARNVLRLRAGETLILHDGQGRAYTATLGDGAGKTAIAHITDAHDVTTEPKTRITVAQALPKTSDKVEQVLQHGTEIGAAQFVFFQSERSVARMEARDKIEKRLERWAEIVKGAAEQSGRGLLPTVRWEPWLKGLLTGLGEYDLTLVMHEGATVPLRAALGAQPDARRVCILVGPEGGFAEPEVAALEAAGAMSVTLGPRVLRTETAALVAVAQILYERDATG